jgi:uncharacterized membrane protein
VRRRLALALLGAGVPLACAPSPAPDAAPRLVVDPASFDFGDVRAGSEPTRRFRLRNAGSAPLKIEGVSSSCDCLVSRPDMDTIPAGGSTELRVTLSVSEEAGPLLRTVTVRTNDPARPEQTIEVRATVVSRG